MAELIINKAGTTPTRHYLTLKPQTVGRDPACDVVVDDATVSRHHADIRGEGQGRFIIRDLGSKNGTFINDAPITSRLLVHGDEITFGSVAARFESSEVSRTSSGVTLQDQTTAAAPSVSYISGGDRLLLSQQRLQMLYEISDRLTGLRDRQDLLADIMKVCIEMFHFERGAIGLRQRTGRRLDWPVVHNLGSSGGEIKISRTILKQALEEGQRVIFSDASEYMSDPSVSIIQQGTRSAMCVPIAYSDEILGVIYGDRISTSRKYEQEDADFLAAIARQLSIGLANAYLLEEQQKKTLLERDIAIARQIQSELFPETLEVHAALQIAALNDPGRQVSGDYFDIIPVPGAKVGLIVADVTGKGVPAAMLAANLQAGARLLFPEITDLAKLASKLNTLVYDNTDSSRFITASLAIIDPDARVLSYVNAGHYPPMLLKASGEVETADQVGGAPLGVNKDEGYEVYRVDLGPESQTLFFFTDGLNEALDPKEEQFGTERIVKALASCSGDDPQQLIANVRKAVETFSGGTPQGDDITMVAVRISQQSADGSRH